MPNPHPLKHRDFLKKLRKFGITEIIWRGKGSERMLVLKSGIKEGGGYTGPSFPIKCHGEGDEHPVGFITAVLRHFHIDANHFWK